MDWYLKAANNGNTKAMNMTGQMYENGFGVTKNIQTAIEWYTKAANQGHEWSQYDLGKIYQDEVKDLQKAVNWYQKAADKNQGNAEEIVYKLNKQGYYAKKGEQEGIINNCI
jgi:TPR repeat protein